MNAEDLPKYYCDLFPMGTLACPVCGFLFPLTTSRNTQTSRCVHCGMVCLPNPKSDALTFDVPADMFEARKQHSTGVSTADAAVLDNRVQEDAFCERCNAFRPCYTFAQQTRGADEGQTIFLTCTVCKSEWSQNS